MTLTATLTTKIALWTTQNPVAARALMLAIPFLAAAVTALVTHQPVFACSGTAGGGCGGG